MKASSMAALALITAGCATQTPTISKVPASNPPPPPTPAHVAADDPAAETDRTVAAGPMMGGQPQTQPSTPATGTGIGRGVSPRTRGRVLPPTTFMRPAQPVPLGPLDVTPGRGPRNQAEWDYVLSRLSWGQRMSLINQARERLGMQPYTFPPYGGQPISAPIDPWSGRGQFRGAPDTSFLPPVPQPVPMGGR